MRQTVVLTARLPSVAEEMLSQEFDVIVADDGTGRSEDELIDLVQDADGLICLLSDPVTRRVLESNPNLRIVANYAVGVNNIDLEAARELGIAVTNTPEVLTDATADIAIALLLTVTRRVIEGDRMVRRGEFTGWAPELLLGDSIAGKTLGIVGMGRIGFATAMRARVFGMNIIYAGRRAHGDADEMLDARLVPFDELLADSDVISLHAPLTAETRHMFDAQAIARMKRGAYIINTARGPIVDEAALADALANGKLGGAGLDVYEFEPSVTEKLLALDNVVLLPHLGSATRETRDEMARMVASDVAAVLRGGAPRFRVV